MTTKVRIDSWYAGLSEEQLWALYARAKVCQWYEAAEWAKKELGVEKVSRAAWYRWLDWMRGVESERRLAQARIAALEVDDLAKSTGLGDEKAVAAYKSLAAEFALRSDAKTASKYLHMALALRDRQLKSQEVEIASAKQRTKDEQLKLAREKFEAAERRLERVAEIADAARGGKVDPAKVADEIDRILGRKK